jgi:hypothetical protein
MYTTVHEDEEDFQHRRMGVNGLIMSSVQGASFLYVESMECAKFNKGFEYDHKAHHKLNVTTKTNYHQTIRLVGMNSTNWEGKYYVNFINKHFKCNRVFKKAINLHNQA